MLFYALRRLLRSRKNNYAVEILCPNKPALCKATTAVRQKTIFPSKMTILSCNMFSLPNNVRLQKPFESKLCSHLRHNVETKCSQKSNDYGRSAQNDLP